ncbi:MAG: hypothetical protein J1E03_04375 [Acetatifactor sp.]|nr:hypothetical protein [Acetatifactor sp.]
MKKIINGKKYDTETATLIGEYWNGYGDFYCVLEKLYRKKTGEYFLYAEGGALTEYAEHYDNGQSDASHIFPYTEKEAKNWAMKKISVDEFESLFGEVEE